VETSIESIVPVLAESTPTCTQSSVGVTVEVSVPLDEYGEARELTVRVEPGRFGPIGDRVLLRRGTLLVD